MEGALRTCGATILQEFPRVASLVGISPAGNNIAIAIIMVDIPARKGHYTLQKFRMFL